MNISVKRQNGVYYTNLYNPFKHKHFIEWSKKIGLQNKTILEPFAGANHIIYLLKDIGVCYKFASFDINSKDKKVLNRDTISNFPKDYDVCITNPPWLYKSRAKRLNLLFHDNKMG